MNAFHAGVRMIFCAALFLMGTGHFGDGAQAQQLELDVVSNADSASVYVDGTWVGRIADAPFSISATSRVVVVQAPGDGIWSIDPLRFELPSDSRPRISLDASFAIHYRFDSVPSGASVFSGSKKLGLTPLMHKSERPLSDMVRIQLEGYQEVQIEPGSAIWNHIPVQLEALDRLGEAVGSHHIVDDKGPNWVNIAVTASAFAAGALAVHYRTKADNRFEDYGVSGKESLRSDIRRLDVQSGVALGVMQAGLGFVAFRLAF